MTITTLAKRVAPRLLWRYRVRRWGIDPGEPEAALLPDLCNRRRLSIDIGAADGSYTALMVPLSSRVVAFEPVPRAAEALRKQFAGTSIVQIEEVALSNQPGSAILRVPMDRTWRSTIEVGNKLVYDSKVEEITVKVSSLDQYSFRDVGLMKIDVEGHEVAVLNGALETIRRERPNVIVEIDHLIRAGALEDAFAFFEAVGYSGLFVLDGKLQSLSAFDRRIHQDERSASDRGEKAGLYINNFVFVPSERPIRAWRTP